jgi:hypothetical protein
VFSSDLFVSYEINNASSTNSVTTNAPSSISTGNLLIAVFNTTAGSALSLTVPSGWTLVNTTVNRFFAHKVASGSEPANYTFTTSSNFTAATCAIMNFSSAAIDVFGTTSAAGTNPTAPSITLAQDNSLVLCVVASNATSNSVSVSGFTEIYERTAASAQDVSSKSFNSGATGTVATTASSSGSRASLIGLKPN